MSAAQLTVCRTVAELRAVLGERREQGETIALVPTMGALHAGHVSLIERAAEEADCVVVSVFVNPRQFGDSADLAAYPREHDRDAEIAAEAGAGVVFCPEPAEIYPAGFSTEVRVTGPLTETLEGAHRGPEHFHGVTTVVTKLLAIAAPDVAVFGSKDAQQLRVIERLVRDLHLPVRIVRAPTVREPDGLALSSRNVRLSRGARQQALSLSAALFAARDAVVAGARDRETILSPALAVLDRHDVAPEYLELCDSEDLSSLETVTGDATIVIAATIGGVRLIDTIDVS
ncbi:MAG: pantoate--beta-alanine ligase [Baekduia sp.]